MKGWAGGRPGLVLWLVGKRLCCAGVGVSTGEQAGLFL